MYANSFDPKKHYGGQDLARHQRDVAPQHWLGIVPSVLALSLKTVEPFPSHGENKIRNFYRESRLK